MRLKKILGTHYRRACWKKGLTLAYENGDFVYKLYGVTEGKPSKSMLNDYDDFYITQKGIKKMKIKDLNFIGTEYITVMDKEGYFYKSNLEVTVGDKIVVENQSGFRIVEVKEINTSDTKAKSWVVDVVDFENYEKLRQKSERKKTIMARLDSKLKKVLEVNKYEFLAKEDKEAAELLKELKDL